MNQELTKELIQNLMKIEGEVRGVVFKTDAEYILYILRTEGEKGLKEVEKELERLGQPIKYKEIDTMAFYPIGLRALSLLAIKKVFNFDDQKIREMGAAAPKTSLIIKLFMQYFLSIRKTIAQVPKMWRKHYTLGDLVPAELDEKKKILILRLKNLSLHPIFCCYLTGYFSKVVEMVVKAPVSCQETKCVFRGDEYHEYLFKW